MADNTTFALTVRTNGAIQAVNDMQAVGNQIQRTGETIRQTENQIRNAANSAGRAVSEQSGISARAVAIGNFIASGITKAVGAVQSFLSGSVDAYAMQEQSEAKLGAALKATGYAAGFTQKQLEDYASELQNMTTFGDEATLQSMTMLAAFKNIRGDNFKQAQLAAMNMAEAMGKSLPEAVKLFGASLNNPIEGISKLKESGIQFSKEQIAQITELTNAGKIAEAQSIILAEAQARWGGAAAAAAQTATGQMKQVTNAAGDIKEGLGGILMNVFSLAGGGSTLSQTFSEWAGYLKEHMNEIAFSIVSVGLKIMEIAERIIVLFEPVWTTIIASVWSGCGVNMLIYLGGIKQIPLDLYEAATIDGANTWQRFRNITIPSLKPVTFMILLTSMINAFKVFAMVQTLTNGGPGTSTTYMIQYIYQTGFTRNRHGYASAASMILFVVLLIISFVQTRMNAKQEEA